MLGTIQYQRAHRRGDARENTEERRKDGYGSRKSTRGTILGTIQKGRGKVAMEIGRAPEAGTPGTLQKGQKERWLWKQKGHQRGDAQDNTEEKRKGGYGSRKGTRRATPGTIQNSEVKVAMEAERAPKGGC